MTARKITYEIVEDLFKSKGYKLISTTYEASGRKLDYECKRHPGEILHATYTDMNREKAGCPYCSGRKLHYLDVKKEFEDRGYTLISKSIGSGKEKVQYKCPNHPNEELWIAPAGLKAGSGCPLCGQDNRTKNLVKSTYEEIRDEFLEKGYILLSKEYKGVNYKYQFQCANHPEEELWINITDFRNGGGCKFCTIESNESKGEKAIKDWLDEHEIQYDREVKFEECKHIDYLRFDFLVPYTDGTFCLIEFDGRLHYRPYNDSEKNRKQFENQKIRDQIKNEFCSKHNIDLLRISYKELKNIDKILELKFITE
jgi:hypothetical protein